MNLNPHILPSVNLMRAFGLEPDPWQLQVLEARPKRLLLNCSRQAGKSTTVAMLALGEAVVFPKTLVLMLSRSLRQATELFRSVSDFFFQKRSPMVRRKCGHELQLSNDSRIVSLPCSGDTIRGFANVKVLIIDEAARVPDDLYRTVRPMLAVSGGRLLCLSTPYGKRGFFYDAWAHGGPEWMRVEVPASQVPRITPEFLEEERRNLGESWYRQEYCCSFEALEGLVYPDFAKYVACEPGASATGVLVSREPLVTKLLFGNALPRNSCFASNQRKTRLHSQFPTGDAKTEFRGSAFPNRSLAPACTASFRRRRKTEFRGAFPNRTRKRAGSVSDRSSGRSPRRRHRFRLSQPVCRRLGRGRWRRRALADRRALRTLSPAEPSRRQVAARGPLVRRPQRRRRDQRVEATG